LIGVNAGCAAPPRGPYRRLGSDPERLASHPGPGPSTSRCIDERCGRDVETGVAAPSQGQIRPAWAYVAEGQ